MKRVWPAWLLLGLGAFFLTSAAIAQFWAKDAAERIPLDSYQRTYLTGPGDVLDSATGKTTREQVKITNITQVDDKLSTGSVVVFVTSTCVNHDIGDPADCLKKSDPRMISVTKLNYASDRHTAMAIDDPKFVTNDPPVQGLTNKWPFYPKNISYPVWDDTSKQATPAEYVGDTVVQGLKCKQYHQVVTGATIDLGNNILADYSLDETYTIDAVTGKIINQQLRDLRTLKDGGATALDLRVSTRRRPSPTTSTTPSPPAGSSSWSPRCSRSPASWPAWCAWRSASPCWCGPCAATVGTGPGPAARRTPPRAPASDRLRLSAGDLIGPAQARSAAEIAVPGVRRPRRATATPHAVVPLGHGLSRATNRNRGASRALRRRGCGGARRRRPARTRRLSRRRASVQYDAVAVSPASTVVREAPPGRWVTRTRSGHPTQHRATSARHCSRSATNCRAPKEQKTTSKAASA